jgi:AcrR family transcriptional regulator
MPARRTPAQPPRKRGPGRPPGSSRDATRARILAAARDCFARSGYVGTTNQQIGERAGITAAAIYQYFDSKTALYMATVKDAQEELVPQFRAATAGAKSARDGLGALLLASARLHARDPSLATFLSALPVELRRHEEIASAMAEAPSEVLTIIQEVVERGVRSGEIAEAAAGHVISMFLACTMGLSLYAASIDPDHLGDAVGAFVAMMEGKLFASRATRGAADAHGGAPKPRAQSATAQRGARRR